MPAKLGAMPAWCYSAQPVLLVALAQPDLPGSVRLGGAAEGGVLHPQVAYVTRLHSNASDETVVVLKLLQMLVLVLCL
ncbi:hypothetical protein XHV734_3344 [Xanthomonas hortorum pv. vitians]|nr:hypothetical protein XHV734_3344 [Xanthomonas hortorum pv. vitians]